VDPDHHSIDINPTMLAKARGARYSPWSLRETLEEMRNRCFRREGADFLLDESFRKIVSFEERNLAVEGGLTGAWSNLTSSSAVT